MSMPVGKGSRMQLCDLSTGDRKCKSSSGAGLGHLCLIYLTIAPDQCSVLNFDRASCIEIRLNLN